MYPELELEEESRSSNLDIMCVLRDLMSRTKPTSVCEMFKDTKTSETVITVYVVSFLI